MAASPFSLNEVSVGLKRISRSRFAISAGRLSISGVTKDGTESGDACMYVLEKCQINASSDVSCG